MEPDKVRLSELRFQRARWAYRRERRIDEGASPVQQYFITSTNSRSYRLLRGAMLVFALMLPSYSASHAQFERLAGRWEGSGSIELSNGTREKLKCVAAYMVHGDKKNLQLNIRCAGDSYNMNISSYAIVNAGAVTGNWSESNSMAGGAISGKASGDHIQIVAESSGFSATLSLTTHSDRQSVSIRSRSPDSPIKGASMNLRRSGSASAF